MQQIGYFLYMEEEARKQQEQLKINAEKTADLEQEQTTTKKEKK